MNPKQILTFTLYCVAKYSQKENHGRPRGSALKINQPLQCACMDRRLRDPYDVCLLWLFTEPQIFSHCFCTPLRGAFRAVLQLYEKPNPLQHCLQSCRVGAKLFILILRLQLPKKSCKHPEFGPTFKDDKFQQAAVLGKDPGVLVPGMT